MSEKLTAADIFNGYAQSDVYDNSCLYSDNALRAMEEYAAQQVQQITEERDRAISLALSYRRGSITDPEKDFEAMEFLTTIKQTNG